MGTTETSASVFIARLNGTQEERIVAARSVKNAVVGNPTNKRLFLRLGVVPPLVAAAADVQSNPALVEQAIAALGSLGSFLPPDAVAHVTPVLLASLFSLDPRPVNAAIRALKMLVSSQNADMASLGKAVAEREVASRLVVLICGPDEGIAEASAVILAKTCTGPSEADVYERVGAVSALVGLLYRTSHERCVEACLNAMSALARQNGGIVETLAGRHNIVTLVQPFTRSTRRTLRLSVCRLLTIFHKADQLPSGLDGIVTTTLVGLVNTDDVNSQICTAYTLVELLLGSEDLQREATDANAVEKLTHVIKFPADSVDRMNTDGRNSRGFMNNGTNATPSITLPDEDRAALRAAAFTALAAVCSEYDEAREKVVKLQMLPVITDSLSGSYPDVVMGSVKCMHSLSRSVMIVRRDIVKENVGRVLLNLLSAENRELVRVASSALCNLVLEFSPVRIVVLEKGGTAILVDLLRSSDEELRKNALWVLKNLFFKADSETKSAVMAGVGYDNLQSLCSDRHPRVRELAMTVVRNLACSGSAEAQSKQLDALFAATGDRLISLLSEVLRIDFENVEIAVQALYVVCNIASGTEAHKTCLMDSDIPKLILRWTSHENERARIAAVWCAINLSWKGRPIVSRNRNPPRLMRRPERSGRNPRSRLDMLRRQHLPLPLSVADRRALEGSHSADRHSLISQGGNRSEASNADADIAQGESGISAPVSAHESDGGVEDAVMSVSHEGNAQKGSGYEWRIRRLRELGFECRLRSLVNDPHIEVQGRARAALELFDCDDVQPLDYNPTALLDYNSPLMPVQPPRSPSVLLRVAESDSSSPASST